MIRGCCWFKLATLTGTHLPLPYALWHAQGARGQSSPVPQQRTRVDHWPWQAPGACQWWPAATVCPSPAGSPSPDRFLPRQTPFLTWPGSVALHRGGYTDRTQGGLLDIALVDICHFPPIPDF